jgi:ABC-type multidrug transport system fused ATPase/permease subunit
MIRSLIQTTCDLIASLPRRRRMQLAFLLVLMLVAAVAEMISLGAILPFLAVLSDTSRALQQPQISKLVNILGFTGADDLRWPFTLLFGATVIASGVVRFMLVYATARINFGIGHELGVEVYRRALYQPYEVHVTRNSSEIMGGISKVDEVVWLVFSILNMTSAFVIAVLLTVVLVLIDPLLAICTLTGLGSVYGVVSLFARKRLGLNSLIYSRAINSRVQEAQEGLGGIRDVLLDHTQTIFTRRFSEIDLSLRQVQASNNIIGPSPRFAVESVGMVLIALLAYNMSNANGGLIAAIPVIGALTLGAQRLMPLIQQIYGNWVQVSGNRQILHDVVDLLKQPIPKEAHAEAGRLPFDGEIRFAKVSFRYQSHMPLVLSELDLTIPKGARIGFIGTTGSGKSTVLDLLMGLLQPNEGEILVDGRPLVGSARLAWQNNVAHVPQSIFLADASFAQNIAFGVPPDEIDFARVRKAAEQAQIANVIEADPKGYRAMVGERGVRLSGGQRQRIGIARALYKRSSVLVLDEATSALDRETEMSVMKSIESLGRELTIIIIAHRVETLQSCDCIYRLEKSGLLQLDGIEPMSFKGDLPKQRQNGNIIEM